MSFTNKTIALLLLIISYSFSLTPEDYANKWLVIAGGSKQGTQPQIPEYFTKIGKQVPLLNSGDFSNLNAGLTILIPDVFSQKEDALNYSKKLRKNGIESYVKFSGDYIGQNTELTIWWIEKHEDKLFMAIPISETELNWISPRPSNPTPLSYKTWVEPISKTKKLGNTHIGQTVSAFAHNYNQPFECTIKNYVWLTRGEPHFSYYQEYENSNQTLTNPGCGSPQVFAEIDCNGDDLDYAINVKDTATAIIYSKIDTEENIPLSRWFTVQEAYMDFIKEVKQEAKNKNQELNLYTKIEKYKNEKTYSVVSINATTGEGNNECGAEDLNITLTGVFEEPSSTNSRRTIFPFQKEFSNIKGITDLNHDGQIEVFDETFYKNRFYRTEKSQNTRFQEIRIDYCDCGC